MKTVLSFALFVLLTFALQGQTPEYLPIWSPGELHWCLDPTADEIRREVAVAVEFWSLVIETPITETKACAGDRTITVRVLPLVGEVATGAPPPSYSTYPPQRLPEPLAGDLIVTSNVKWNVYNRGTLVAALLKAIGQALGIPHMMDGPITPWRLPSSADIAAARCLYLGKDHCR